MQDTEHEQAIEAARPIIMQETHSAPDVRRVALWMLEHAGYSYRPAIESRAEGYARGALELAGAELELERRDDVRVTWDDDPEGWQDDAGTHYPAWCARVEHEVNAFAPEVLESLGGIDVEPGTDHARVIEAQLALQANVCAPADRDVNRPPAPAELEPGWVAVPRPKPNASGILWMVEVRAVGPFKTYEQARAYAKAQTPAAEWVWTVYPLERAKVPA